MQASHLSVTEIRFDAETGRFLGKVGMNLSGGRVPLLLSFQARAEQPRDCPRSLVIYALLKDALRQARELPPLRGRAPAIAVDFDNIRIEAA